MVYCKTCKKDVETPCKNRTQRDKCIFNKLQPIAEVKPVKIDPDYKNE